MRRWIAYFFGVTVWASLLVWASDPSKGEGGNGGGMDDQTNRKYIVVIDAGSTGSRIHVYPYVYVPNSSLPRFMIDQEFSKKLSPGLSSFEKNPSKAGSSIDGILAEAKKNIPADQIGDTPVFLVATAGLRKVQARNVEATEKILESVRATISKSGFKFKPDWAQIISGIDEGRYGWVTVNYLLGNFEKETKKTTGVFEMGGESVQLTYMPDPGSEFPANMLSGITIAGKSYNIFTHSWMGYGMQAAQTAFDASLTDEPESPCYLRGDTRESDDGEHTWEGSGNWEACYYNLKNIIANRMRDGNCNKDDPAYQCSLDGIPVPRITDEKFFLIENFWYTANVVGQKAMSGPGYFNTMKELGVEYCSKKFGEAKAYVQTLTDREPFPEEIKKQCFATAYIGAMLKEGFSFDSYPNFDVVREVDGGDIDWAVGYAIVAEASGAAYSGILERTPNFLWVVLLVCAGAGVLYCWYRRKAAQPTGFPRYSRGSTREANPFTVWVTKSLERTARKLFHEKERPKLEFGNHIRIMSPPTSYPKNGMRARNSPRVTSRSIGFP